jgi:uncharacterized phage protein gp47/JayE
MYHRVTTIANNTATTFQDNVTDATVFAAPGPPTADTAEVVLLNANATDPGVAGNVVGGAITELTDAPSPLTDVTNPQPFTGGSEVEDTEAYRQRLLDFIRNPDTGSAADIKAWAEGVTGVETATVFENTPANGSVTVNLKPLAIGSMAGSKVVNCIAPLSARFSSPGGSMFRLIFKRAG